MSLLSKLTSNIAMFNLFLYATINATKRTTIFHEIKFLCMYVNVCVCVYAHTCVVH